MATTTSHEFYNSLPCVEEQHAALNESSFRSVSGALSDLFVRHHAHLDFGISLPHQHQTLPPKHAMVHHQDQTGRDICRPEPLPTSRARIYPRSYQLHEGRFMPFEFSSTRIPEPPSDFLLELAKFLLANSLDDILSVCSITAEDSLWLETMTPDLCGTIAVQLSQEQDLAVENYIVTEWAVRQDTNGARVVPARACETLSNGGHKRT